MKYGLQFKPAEFNGIELKNNHKVVKATIIMEIALDVEKISQSLDNVRKASS